MEHYAKGNFMKNLKSLWVLTASVVAVFVMSSCQGENNNNSNNAAAMNNVCVTNPAACQSGVYQQGYGFQPYTNGYNTGYGYPNGQNGFQWMNNSAYLCSCPAGSIPTYNSYGGLGCVNNTLISGGGYAYFGWGTGSGATNNQWMNIPQISNYTGYNNNSSCYNGVVQSCLVDQPSSCSAGYTCRATAAQSRVGLCVSNSATNGGTQYGGGYR
jgi:hypothetical protein